MHGGGGGRDCYLVILKSKYSFFAQFRHLRESFDPAALWMKTLPNRLIMVRFLLKTIDLAIGKYIVMQHPNLFDCQFEALPANGWPCKERMTGQGWYSSLPRMQLVTVPHGNLKKCIFGRLRNLTRWQSCLCDRVSQQEMHFGNSEKSYQMIVMSMLLYHSKKCILGRLRNLTRW